MENSDCWMQNLAALRVMQNSDCWMQNPAALRVMLNLAAL